MLSLATR